MKKNNYEEEQKPTETNKFLTFEIIWSFGTDLVHKNNDTSSSEVDHVE